MTRLSSLIDKGLNTPYIIADNNYYIPTGSVILYGGASDPGLTSQGWSYASEYNGYYILGTTVNSSIGNLSSGTPTSNGTSVQLTVGTAGAHTGTSVSAVYNVAPAPSPAVSGMYSPQSAGGHTHTAYAVLDNVASDLNPPTRGWILLKSIKNTTVFPPSTILISSSQPTGSTQLTATDTYTYIKGSSSPVLLAATSRSMNASPATDPGVSPAPGYHSHKGNTTQFPGVGTVTPGTVPGVYILEPSTITPIGTTPWPPASSAMYHTHSLSGGNIQCTSLTGKIVKLWQIAQYSIPESATVIMYSGAIADLPNYWKICDGNNGTINMNGYFLGYSNSAATAHDTTTTTTITTSTITMSTNLWFHTHTSGVYDAAGGYTWPVAHAAENQPHTHPVSNTGVTASYTPPSVKLCFIQFVADIVPSTAVNTPNVISIVPSVTSVDEGSSVTFNVVTWEVTDGSTLYWTIQTNSSDFSTTSGSFIINNNLGTFSLTPTMDQLTEGNETFSVSIRTVSIAGSIIGTSDPITINDTSLTPTYSVSTTSTIINEGTTVIYTVTTTNLPNGYTLYYSNSGTTSAADFTDGLNSGSFTVTNNTATISKTLVNDVSFNEGSETLILQLRTGSISGTVVATSTTVTVVDTSFVTYSVTPDVTTVNEGSTVTFTVTTQNIANGTILYYTNSGTTSAADFTDGLNSGSFTITNNTATITKTLVNDVSLNEGNESIIIEIRAGIPAYIVATASTVTVVDTSRVPTYSITTDVAGNITEGATINFTITTTNVVDGTVLYWIPFLISSVSGDMRATDFTDGNITGGSVTVSNNVASFSRTWSSDTKTEGNESYRFYIRKDSAIGTIVATSRDITVTDTSTGTSEGILLVNTPATSGSWTVPAGVTSILVEAWGAGGGARNGSFLSQTSGGGGGYARTTLTVTPGSTIKYSVGQVGFGSPGTPSSGGASYVTTLATGTPTSSTQGCLAFGGGSGSVTQTLGYNSGTGTAWTSQIGTTTYAGGIAGLGNGRGGAGGAAGPNGPGIDGGGSPSNNVGGVGGAGNASLGGSGGVAGSDVSNGGSGGSNALGGGGAGSGVGSASTGGGTGGTGGTPGGGGGGSIWGNSSVSTGGTGGGGQIKITW